MTYEMIKAMLVFFLDIWTICLLIIGKPRYFKIPYKGEDDLDLLKEVLKK